jgi:hypothetical protein
MTADEKLARIRIKVEWAKHHFRYLERSHRRFLKTKPYAFSTDLNVETGYTEFRLLKDAEIPPDAIGLLAGDVAHNLRSALDHLAFQLWLNSSLRTGDGKHVYFPTFASAEKYKTSDGRKVEGMTEDAIDAIMATEPYYGGKGHSLWLTNELDIADKHQTLVTADIRAMSLSTTFITTRPKHIKPGIPYTSVHTFGDFTFPGFRAPAKAGEIIATVETKPDEKVQPTFDVAFSQPKVVEGKSVIETLQYMINSVENLLPKFTPLL